MVWGFLLDLDEWADWQVFISQTMRVVAIVLLSVASGLMARYYLTRPRMPVKAFVGYGCFSFALLGAEVYKVSSGTGPFRWWLSPFVIAGSLSTISGVLPALQWRHGQVESDVD